MFGFGFLVACCMLNLCGCDMSCLFCGLCYVSLGCFRLIADLVLVLVLVVSCALLVLVLILLVVLLVADLLFVDVELWGFVILCLLVGCLCFCGCF